MVRHLAERDPGAVAVGEGGSGAVWGVGDVRGPDVWFRWMVPSQPHTEITAIIELIHPEGACIRVGFGDLVGNIAGGLGSRPVGREVLPIQVPDIVVGEKNQIQTHVVAGRPRHP